MKKRSFDLIFCILTGGITSIVIFLVLLMLAAGCSATKKIAEEVNKVRTNATEIKQDTGVIKQNTAVVRQKVGTTQPVVAQALNTIDQRADSINAKADGIVASADSVTATLPQVQDRTPYWLTVLKWFFVALVVLAVLFIGWRLYIFEFVGKAFQSFMTWGHGVLGKWMGA